MIFLGLAGAAWLGFLLWRSAERRRIREIIPLLEDALGNPILLIGAKEKVLALGERARGFLALPHGLPEEDLDGIPIPGLGEWFERARLNPSGEGVVSLLHQALVRDPTSPGSLIALPLELRYFQLGRYDLVALRDRREVCRGREEDAFDRTFFLQQISHEFRTPLMAIKGYTEWVADSSLGERERVELLGRIQENASELTRILDVSMDWASLESEGLKLHLETPSVQALLIDLLSEWRPVARSKGLGMGVLFRGKVPPRVVGDATRIRQVLGILVGNGLKFSSEGAVLIEVEYTEQSGHLRFLIRDTGPGVSDEVRAQLFRPFARADKTMARRFDGFGLGLSVASRLAGAMGGEVDLLASNESGSVFVLTLPVFRSQDLWVEDLGRETEGDFLPGQGRLEGVSILVADDGVDNLGLIERMLRSEGAKVWIASEGNAALSLNRQHEIDAVLLDQRMPGMDGLAVAQVMRTEGFEGPILGLTGNASDIPEQVIGPKRRSSVLDLVIQKPFRKEVLLQSLLESLERKEVKRSSGMGLLQGKRILLAEDNPDTSRLVTFFLKNEGATVEVAQNGALALEKVKKGALSGKGYDLILLDMQMPVMDGYEAAQTLRDMGFAQPVIALTAHARSEDREACLAAGCSQFLKKPIGQGALVEALLMALGEKKEEPSPSDTEMDVWMKDPEFMAMIEEFAESLRDRLEEMWSAWDKGDLEKLQQISHKIKGAAGGFGMGTVSEAAAELEDLLFEAADLKEVENALRKVEGLSKKPLLGFSIHTKCSSEVME
jgi:CheY-like chemotaxis protein/signal transduction histidine kinase